MKHHIAMMVYEIDEPLRYECQVCNAIGYRDDRGRIWWGMPPELVSDDDAECPCTYDLENRYRSRLLRQPDIARR